MVAFQPRRGIPAVTEFFGQVVALYDAASTVPLTYLASPDGATVAVIVHATLKVKATGKSLESDTYDCEWCLEMRRCDCNAREAVCMAPYNCRQRHPRAKHCMLAASTAAAVPPIQIAALKDLFLSTSGPVWQYNDSWLVADPCDNAWFGVGRRAVLMLMLRHAAGLHPFNRVPSAVSVWPCTTTR
jgi:hypothetical protein